MFQKQGKAAAVVAVGMLCGASGAFAATIELVTNGDFESGNVGFTSDFTNVSPSGFPGLAQVSVTSGPFLGLTANGGSNFLAVNGGNNPNVDPTIWSQDVAVQSGVTYTLSFALGRAFPGTPGNLSARVNGNEIINAFAPATDDTYATFSSQFTSMTTGTVALSFVELSTDFGGNDYGLDDISLSYDDGVGVAPVPLPAGGLLLLSGLGAIALRRRLS